MSEARGGRKISRITSKKELDVTRLMGVCLTLALVLSGATVARAAEPTCSAELGIVVHGQHIVGDYVTGIGHGDLAWPTTGGVVGEAIAGTGVAVAGGPGPGFHFPNGFAPGASLCVDRSASPGVHF